jgi:hypothetical protein
MILFKEIDEKISVSENHLMHTLVAVFAFIEVTLVPRVFPKSKQVLRALNVITVVYFIFAFVMSMINGHFPYPLFGALNEAEFCILIAIVVVWFHAIHFFGCFLNRKVRHLRLLKN